LDSLVVDLGAFGEMSNLKVTVPPDAVLNNPHHLRVIVESGVATG
jgi:hypothetical protein